MRAFYPEGMVIDKNQLMSLQLAQQLNELRVK
jgi:hypothetical protein